MALTLPSARPRKIIGVISFMNAAGAQEALLRLARQMRARGHHMEVWFLYQEAQVHADEPFIRVFEPTPRLSAIQYVRVFIRLCHALANERPDAVLGFLPLGNVFGLTAAAIAGVPRRIASQRAPAPTFGRVMRALDRLLGSSRVYDRIICVSEAVRASFAHYPAAYRVRLSVVHNGIDWRAASESPAEARRALDLPSDAFLYVAVGRLKPQKNYDFLIEAFAGVSDGVLVIAGDGLLNPQLEAKARAAGVISQIIFLGAVDRAGVRRLLRAADVFVQPSLYEGQSNAVLEAMHAALPIIVSDIPEQRETVLDPDTGEIGGMVVPLGDTTAWANALNTLRADSDRRAFLSAAAKAIVERRFALSRMIDGFETELIVSSHRANAATIRRSAADLR